MAKKFSVVSPLVKLERKTLKQKKKQSEKNKGNTESNNDQNDPKRNSLISSYSTDTITTTGRLLDKLKLADEEWDDSQNSEFDNSNFVDSDLSFVSNNSMNTSNTSIPSSKFKTLKSVLGSTRRQNHEKSAAKKALELGKTINTVEQNASRVFNRADIKSIHLDSLIQDTDDSSSLDSNTEDENEILDDYYFHKDNHSEKHLIDDNDYQNKINGTDNIRGVTHSKNSSISNSTIHSFVPHTPTKNTFNITPVGSPKTLHDVTSQQSFLSTPKKNYHKHSASNVSNTSYGYDNTNEFLLANKPDDNLVFNFNDNHNHNHNYNIDRKVSHTHTRSAVTHNNINNKQNQIDDDNSTLMRSASVPIQRKLSVKHSPAPNKPLPPNPVDQKRVIHPNVSSHYNELTPSTSSSFPNTPNVTKPYPIQPDYYYAHPHPQQQQQQQKYHHFDPHYNSHKNIPEQSHFHHNPMNPNRPYYNNYPPNDSMIPPNQKIQYLKSPTLKNRTYNMLYPNSHPNHNPNGYLGQPNTYQQHQQIPQQQQRNNPPYPYESQRYNNNNNNMNTNPPNVSPRMDHSAVMNNYRVNNNIQSSPSSFPKKKYNHFQDVDLSNIIPR